MKTLSESELSQINVLVIGDIMLDHYLFGGVNRMSPEAPVPVVDIAQKQYCLGGAANVALNVKALGANPILLSMAGKDTTGNLLVSMLREARINCSIGRLKGRTTTLKTRIFNHCKQILRFDEEQTGYLNTMEEQLMIRRYKKIISAHPIDVIILEDYNKGLMTCNFIQQILLLASTKKIPVVVDPKKNNFLEYTDVDVFKPNLREFSEAIGRRLSTSHDVLRKAALELKKQNRFKNLMVTLGNKGIFCLAQDGTSFIVAAEKIKVVDVSGAGDTVISIAAIGLVQKYAIDEIARLANLGAAIVCKKVGVASASLKELNELAENNTDNLRDDAEIMAEEFAY